ncbi:hypothetical protein AB205_0109510, partial [Aquarana catesbeiana]
MDNKQLPDPLNDISVGGWEITDEPIGRLSVWTVSLQGKLWYRENVCHDNPEGSSWLDIETPSEVIQISCGPYDLLWAALWEGQAIVREGISRNCPKGNSWTIVEAPTPGDGIMHVSVGVNVVWAVTKERKVWFRRGVNSHNPCGTSWIEMVGEMAMLSVGLNDQVWGIGYEDRAVYFRQGVTPSELSGKMWKAIVASRENERSNSGSASSLLSAGCFFGDEVKDQSDSTIPSDVDSDAEHTLAQELKLKTSEVQEVTSPIPTDEQTEEPSTVPSTDPQEGNSPNTESPTEPSTNSRMTRAPQWSSIDLAEAKINALQPSDDKPSLALLEPFSTVAEEPFVNDLYPLWTWVSGGGCLVDSVSPLKWFSRPTVWVKTGSLQWWREWKPNKWIDVRVALEQMTATDGSRDSILFIYYTHNEEKKVYDFSRQVVCMIILHVESLRRICPLNEHQCKVFSPMTTKYIHLFLNEVTILVPVLSDTKHTFAIYTSERTRQRWPVRLAAATEEEMHDWVRIVTGGHLRMVESSSCGVVWGIGYDHTAWVYTGGYGGGFMQGLDSSKNSLFPQSDTKCVYLFENQRWNPVTGYSSIGLPTDRYMWSDASGLQECTKTNTKPPSPQWSWVRQFTLFFINCRYNLPSVVNRAGMQDTYHGYKTMKDFVRRRRWARKCKIVTSGPWQEVPPISLWDVSICPSRGAKDDEHISVWAISNKGDVLCRIGVTKQNPA